jgi:hypothetical protein
MLRIALKLYRKHFAEALKVIIFGFVSVFTIITGFSVHRLHESEINRIAQNLRISVLVEHNLSNNDIIALKNQISNIPGIRYSEYTDQEKIRGIFLSENRIDNNTIILDSFPRIILISLEVEYYHSGKLFIIINKIQRLKGVDDTVYDKSGFIAYHKFHRESMLSVMIILSVFFSLMLFYGLTLYNGQKHFYQMNFDVLIHLGFSKARAVLPLTIYELICNLIGVALGLSVFLIIWLSIEAHYSSIRHIIFEAVPVGIVIAFFFSTFLILISNIFFRTSQKK